MENKFSIIIPTFNREGVICRAIDSILNQNYDPSNLEIIVVDDGSQDLTKEIVNDYYGSLVKYIRFEKNQGRLAARNKGMQEATFDWICWLDSDDEFVSTYFSILNEAINANPNYQIFNFGAFVLDEQNVHSWIRNTFLPGVRSDGIGHDVFKSGGIGTGSFIFRRELLEEVGFLPEAHSPYGDAQSLPALATAKWPDLRNLYGQTENGQWKPFGNPWGDDWLMFYLLTRNHLSKPLDIVLYIQHVRH